MNNVRIYQDVAKGAKNMLACTNMTDTTQYLEWMISHGMMKGALMDSYIGECASAKKKVHVQKGSSEIVW